MYLETSCKKLKLTLQSFQALSTKKKKKKRVGMIPIQRTAVSRRRYRGRGTGSAMAGRPRNEQRVKRQLIVNDEDEGDEGVINYKLPVKRKKRSSTTHSFIKSVSKKAGVMD